MTRWQESVASGWHTLSLDRVTVETKDDQHRFQISVSPGELHPDEFKVEMYAGPSGETAALAEILSACRSPTESSEAVVYSVCCAAKRPAGDYTARVVPSHADAFIPLEADQILWQQ